MRYPKRQRGFVFFLVVGLLALLGSFLVILTNLSNDLSRRWQADLLRATQANLEHSARARINRSAGNIAPNRPVTFNVQALQDASTAQDLSLQVESTTSGPWQITATCRKGAISLERTISF